MNRLEGQSSPYLRAHADNPVDWHPWDAEALQVAASENKPILLSIGYSACHWCHVMAHESFEDDDIASQMNEYFVNIKVDREERPDLDRIYQTAHQLLTRNRGGWPLTLFLDPHDHLPFFGGTYFPPVPRNGMPGFADVLARVAEAYRTQHDQLDAFKTQIRESLTNNLARHSADDIDPELVDRACGQLNQSFDEDYGGFGGAPKFPHPAGLALLLDAAACTDDPDTSKRLLYMLDFTLAAMSCGGLYDHLGGGFFRYSTDAEWSIPHFEKMLYDNGPLLSLYARRARATKAPWFHTVASHSAAWITREMQVPNGGLCSSLDADSEGAEGCFYVWSQTTVQSTLGEDYAAFASRFGLANAANFAQQWHLRLAAPQASLALPERDPSADLDVARGRLLAAREQRPRPARDDKILTSWNALAIRGLADIGQLAGRTDYLDRATRSVDYLYAAHWHDGRLLAASTNGHAYLNAYLDDYAFLADALLALLAARWRERDLAFAIALVEVLLVHFEDRNNGGFFFTSDDHEQLIVRSKSFGDEATPAGNAVAARVLLELGHLLGEPRYLHAAERTLRAGMGHAKRSPSSHATLMSALLDDSVPPPRVVLRYTDATDLEAWQAVAAQHLSVRIRCYAIPAEIDTLPGNLNARKARGSATMTAYVCSGHQCSAPTIELVEFGEVLRALSAGSDRARAE
jgi:uncharacterized protein YyaL (SSP411 family)